MDDFTSKPGVPNSFGLVQGAANAVAPGKRPLSSMTPTILLKNGKVFMVTGSPGGSTIITTVLQSIINVVDRSEEHTSELQSLMRISYAVFCLKKKKKTLHNEYQSIHHTKL